jgi:hypothetical protein
MKIFQNICNLATKELKSIVFLFCTPLKALTWYIRACIALRNEIIIKLAVEKLFLETINTSVEGMTKNLRQKEIKFSVFCQNIDSSWRNFENFMTSSNWSASNNQVSFTIKSGIRRDVLLILQNRILSTLQDPSLPAHSADVPLFCDSHLTWVNNAHAPASLDDLKLLPI